MSVMIKGMCLPKHAAFNGEKDTAYKCVVLAHPDNTVELVIGTEFASPYDNGHNIQRYPLTEIPTPHGRLIDANEIKEYAEWHCQRFIDGDHAEVGLTVDQINSFVRNAPTIIEAEVSE